MGATISGTVKDSAGNPITGSQIEVDVYTGDPCGEHQHIQRTSTDSVNGTYAINGLAAGVYFLRTYHHETNYVDEWWTNGSPDPSNLDCGLAQSITVTSGDTIPATDFWLDPGASIAGTVYRSDGVTPITDAEIQIGIIDGDPCGEHMWVGSINTETGAFTLLGVAPGDYYLITNHMDQSNYVNEWWSSQGSTLDCNNAEPVTVTPGGELTGFYFQLELGGSISGTIYESDGVTPVTGAEININALRGDQCHQWLSGGNGTNTNPADGTYMIMGLPPGSYYLETNNHNQNNFVNEWWSSGASTYYCESAESLIVASGGDLTGRDFQLDLGGSISGTITETGGAPISDMHVQVISDGCGGNWLGGNNTDSNGNYTIKGVPVGSVYVQTCSGCSGLNYIDEQYDNKTDCNLADPVAVTQDTNSPGVDFELEPAGTISGMVFNDGGTVPLANVSVCANSEACGGDHYGCTQSDGSGNFILFGMPLGVTTYLDAGGQTYIHEYYDAANGSFDCNDASGVSVGSSDVNFYLELGATISGTVKDSAGNPITGEQINVDVYAGDPCGPNNHIQGTSTDTANGTYTIAGLAGGTYFLKTWHFETNYVDEWWTGGGPDPSDIDCSLAEPITVASGGLVMNKDFQLELGGSISGRVTAPDGDPIANMHVYVQSEGCGGIWLGGENTDSNGDYTIKGIPEGNVYAQTCSGCSGLTYIDEFFDNETDCSQADPVVVIPNANTPNIHFQLDMDTDGDGITNFNEIHVYGTDPDNADTDSDGIHDGDELAYWGGNWNQDPDGDGKNNLVDEDSDNDGYWDGDEIFKGSVPFDSDAIPLTYLYDDFSDTYIDTHRWSSRELVREISGGQLVSKLGNSSSGSTRNATVFQFPETISTIECQITIVETQLDTGDNPASFARIGGIFYNTQVAGGATGDIWAEVMIGDRGNGLEAFWEVEETLNDDNTAWSVVGSGTIVLPGTLNYGTAYSVKLAYDGNNNFTFSVDELTNSFVGPAYQREPVIQHKQLATGIDGGIDLGTGYVHALFDDVHVNNDINTFDDFANAPLDPTLWNSRETVRELTGDHKLLLAAHSEGQREQSTLTFPSFQPYVETKVLFSDESNVSNGAFGRARIDGYFFNDTHGPGEYIGYEGNVWAHVNIDLFDDGSLRAACYVGKSLNADESDWADVFWDEFSIPIQTNREYTLGIHYTGTHFIFMCKDNVTSEVHYKTHEIEAANQYPAYNQSTSLRTRTYGNGSGNGYMKVEFDDAHVAVEPAPSCPGNFGADGDTDGFDLAIFLSEFGPTGCVGDCEGDVDQDGDVDEADLAIFAAGFGRANCPD
jgi:hypothetical protein